MNSITLAHGIQQALIVAYKENTHQLETYLQKQGFACTVMRQTHQPEYHQYSPSYLCLLNHCRAWQTVAASNQPTLICEADFVPVQGLGQLPLPYEAQRSDVAIAWLYTCAPQIYSVSPLGHAIGFSTAMVAYILTPLGAQKLLDFARQILLACDPTQYLSWDSEIEEFLRQQQLKCYVPWRNYGEHGGKPNVEHRRAGLSASHRADVLFGALAFEPIFVTTHPVPDVSVFLVRVKARCKGIGRLLLGKYLRWRVMQGSSTPLRLLKFAVGRQLTLNL